ncbi:ankyrin repeat protein, putative [Trichomonas vaginalis G3]|uniref:Ankyrin repeat protein, putative n=1 Tax=Trichomonas vaginalis (strain ATCC PRA-98 / G3) TaxID=412133 RepID=A2E9Q0_TRIV3|nr:protein ubiquitination [Trichomonas vaginalis G3]EAY10585.1 ankyrin repeat protein, putative [Trichomonas vaginalis G3]KAI5540837.1 protein ubiquitination [Trichomonas vaginalis G3]|eukprot:XP_001322808.1 ankyrin repeat protein [Trichomonas vaginalis G3]
MYNDLENFIAFTERDEFHNNQKLESALYPYPYEDYSLLELCCYHGAVDCFKFLRTKFNSEITQKCLQLSFLGGNPEIMSECLKYRKPDERCMEYAIISHNIDFVTFLMNEYNIKINLTCCEWYNNLESILVYFDQTNDISNNFVYATKFNIPSLCEYFLKHGAITNEKNDIGKTALYYAVRYCSIEMAEILISHGANFNKKDYDGLTSLHDAAIYNNKEMAEFLISHGVNINEKDRYGKTALHYAALYNSTETAEPLISNGANINEKDDFIHTALLNAAGNKNKEMAKFLILHGANVDEKDNLGQAALHFAARYNYKELAELLILHGANINEQNNFRYTALKYAALYRSKETAELLISYGANINGIEYFIENYGIKIKKQPELRI